MACRFLIITFFFPMLREPFAKQLVTNMGSISGVSPTATEIANKPASSQSPLVKPLRRNTIGTIISIKRTKIQETAFIPFSKPVTTGLASNAVAILPKIVEFPTPTTRHKAVPLMTVVPIKPRLASSVTAWSDCAERECPCFSTGTLSPVSAAWLINKSLVARKRTSAGSISPALSLTKSPCTSSSREISFCPCPARITAAVVRIIALSLAAALLLLVSWTKRRIPDKSIIDTMIMTVTGFLSSGAAKIMFVQAEMQARTAKTIVKGLIKASYSLLTKPFFCL